MTLQYSRNCPCDYDFCSVATMFGHRPRLKSPEQVIAELDALWTRGRPSSVFFVDNNLIGNKRSLREKLAPSPDPVAQGQARLHLRYQSVHQPRQRQTYPASGPESARLLHRRLRSRPSQHLTAPDRLHPVQRHCNCHGRTPPSRTRHQAARTTRSASSPARLSLRRRRRWFEQIHLPHGSRYLDLRLSTLDEPPVFTLSLLSTHTHLPAGPPSTVRA